MKNDLLVSVLVPVYGVEQYIERCARSLFGQTYSNVEYVFVNDCTPDKSVEVLQRVLEDYPNRKVSVKIVNHEKNRGLAAARNTALNNATGEFVCHVDSDDWLELDAIEKLVEKQLETGADMVSGNMLVHTIRGVEEYYEPNYKNKEERLLRQLPASMDHNLFRRIIRRSLFEDNHIRAMEGCNMAEDLYFMVRICWFAESFGTVDGFVYHYDLNRPNSYTRESNAKKRVDNQMQLVRNWVGVVGFLADKEEVYYANAVSYMASSVKEALRLTLKFRMRPSFEQLAEIIYGNKALMEKLGWKNNAFGGLSQSYPVMRLGNMKDRAVAFIHLRMKKTH